MANFHAGLLCLGFPLCENGVLPPASALGALHWTHRVLAFAFLGLTLVMVSRVSRGGDPAAGRLRRAAGMVLAATVAQIAVAAAMVLHLLPPALRALHLLVGTLVWAALVVLVFRSRRTPAPVAAESEADRRASRRLARRRPRDAHQATDHLAAAGHDRGSDVHHPGRPPDVEPGLLGGRRRLPDGGRRQHHQHVVRPGHRHPDDADPASADSGRAGSRRAFGLAFGVGLGLAAFAIFWYRVNPLSAWLALGGLLFYVFVYTIWLKRTSPQNIVIGGAAGAFPPLVGLGGDDRAARPGRGLPVRHHLLLDPAALLGARADQAGAITPGPGSR